MLLYDDWRQSGFKSGGAGSLVLDRRRFATTVSVVFLHALGYYALWAITRSIIVTLCYHLLRALGYNAHLVVIYDFIKLKYSILKILFKIIFCTYYALWVITLIRVEFFLGVVVTRV